MRFLFLAVPLLAIALAANFPGRGVWTVQSANLRVTLLQSGGHVAELRLKTQGAVNPLWQQSRPTIDPDTFDPSRDSARYGGDAGARLMSGLAGHNLCFPYWGNPSPEEERAGMTYHGETGITRWTRLSGGADWIAVQADLPQSQTRFKRTVRVVNQVAFFDEEAENLSAWDRPVGWCEHVTFGPPFLERGVTRFSASVARGRTSGGKDVQWKDGLETQSTAGFVDNFELDATHDLGWFTAWNPARRLLVGYIFRTRDFPWLNVWESNAPEMTTRGMEFSNTPVHGTMRALLAEPTLWGKPTFDWLPARGKLTKRYWAFTTELAKDPGEIHGVRIHENLIDILGNQTITLDKSDIEW